MRYKNGKFNWEGVIMIKIKKFEDLVVWQAAIMLTTVDLMKEIESWRNYGLKTHLERSSISIPSNIAEGY